MNCPYCDAEMDFDIKAEKWKCPGGGPLLLNLNKCPYLGELLTDNDIVRIEVALIDLEAE